MARWKAERWWNAVTVAGVLLALKGLLLVFDPTIRIYLGDSAAYLYGARPEGRLPDDRSFTYSLLIRALILPSEQLATLVRWQTLAGIAVAWLLWYTLEVRLSLPRRLAFIAACVLALEPAQLYYERMVLAETAGLLAFVMFFAASGAYLKSRRVYWLPLAAALGLAAVTLRMNYLPVVLVISVGLPLLLLFDSRRFALRTTLVHLAVSVVVVTGFHAAYCTWVGRLFGMPPAYLGRAGFMQLGLVLPLVRPEHLVRVGLPSDLETMLDYPLSDPDARMPHLWAPGGLVPELRRRHLEVEPIARSLSRMALADDPFGLVRLGMHTFGDYFRADEIKHLVDDDLGRRPIPPEILWTLREQWGYDATGLPTRVTLVSRYFEIGTSWLVGCLLLMVPLAVMNAVAHWRSASRLDALLAALVGVGLVLTHLLFVPVALYRYLHPLPFFLLVNALPLSALRLRSSPVPAILEKQRPHRQTLNTSV